MMDHPRLYIVPEMPDSIAPMTASMSAWNECSEDCTAQKRECAAEDSCLKLKLTLAICTDAQVP